MSIKQNLTAKIDLKDAIFGGAAIYASVLLVAYMMIFGTDLALRYFKIIGPSGEFLAPTGMLAENFYSIFIAVLLSVFLITFFVIVLFEESFFSKHEKGRVDLLGLGLVWGMVFVSVDTLIESFMMYLAMYSGWQSYFMLSLRSSLLGPFYWVAVLYIIILPLAIYYLRKNHNEHYSKQMEKK